MHIRTLLFSLLCLTTPAVSRADVIAANYNSASLFGRYYPGQSFTVAGTGAYQAIAFNFFSGSGSTPEAVVTRTFSRQRIQEL